MTMAWYIVLVTAVVLLPSCQGRFNAALGSNVRLACGDFTGSKSVWLKDNIVLNLSSTANGTHLAINSTALVIQDVRKEDAGWYKCINKDNVTLAEFEVTPLEEVVTTTTIPRTRPSTTLATTYDPKKEVWFLDSSLPRNSIWTTTIGQNVVFDCEGSASLSPYIEWFKDKKPIHEANYRFSGINFKWRQQPWILTLPNVLIADSGIYECKIGSRAINKKRERKFHLIVDDVRPIEKPVITLFEPKNVTAVVGSRVKLTCHATAKPMPYIKWERTTYKPHSANVTFNATIDNSAHDEHAHKVAMVNSKITEIEEANYTKIVETVCVHRAFTDSITIDRVQFNDSAVYSCVAFNDFGFVKQTGSLLVVPEPPLSLHALELLFSKKYGGDSSDVGFPMPAVIAMPICLFVLVVIVLVYWHEQRKRGLEKPSCRPVPLILVDHNGDINATSECDASFNDYVITREQQTPAHGANGSVPTHAAIVHPLMRPPNDWDHLQPSPNQPKSKSLSHLLNSRQSLDSKRTKSDDRIQLLPSPPDAVSPTHASDDDLEWEQEDLDLQLTLDDSTAEEQML